MAGARRRGAAVLLATALAALGLAACKSPVVIAACDGTLVVSTSGNVDDAALDEISGVDTSERNPGVLWVHNDSGDGPRVYALDETGALLATYTLAGASAVDWEDLAVGPGPAFLQPYLYLADIGDNARARAEVVVYRLREPAVAAGTHTLGTVDALHLRYPDGAHDAEAFFVDPPTGDLIVVTKDLAGGPAPVYRAPANLPAGSTTTLERVGTVPLPAGLGYAVTAADVDPSGATIAVRTYGAVLLFPRVGGKAWEAFAGDPCRGPLPAELQGEAIALEPGARGYVTIAEGTRPAVRRFRAPEERSEVTVEMQPDHAGGFMTLPWPNDVRRAADGTIDLAGYPGTDANPLLGPVLDAGAAVTRGFGTNAAVFFQATGAVDPATLPDAAGSLGDGATAMLVPLDDPGSPRVPVLADFRVAGTAFRPGNLLTLLPYPGHPLAPSTRYAAVLFDGLRDAEGLRLARAALVDDLAGAWDPGRPVDQATWDALRDQRADVLAYVDAETSWDPDDVVAFTVFTTQDVGRELEAIAASVRDLPSPAPVTRGAGTCTTSTPRTTVSGTLALPRWQSGTRPYLLAGGGVVIGAGGTAVQQGTETAQFRMTFPCGAPPPDGWPILLFVDGTGAGANSANISELGSGTLPYTVASVAPMYSGDRAVPGYAPETLFFNFLNPLAGRTNQLQQAADMLYLERVVQGITLTAAETAHTGPVETDDATVVVAGHSQGALTLPHVLAVDPAVDGAFVSAGGAGLYHSVVHRADVRTQVDALLGTAPGELDAFHPFVHALQTIAEIGDAANYAPAATAHVLSVSGVDDGCSPVEVGSHLGTAFGIPVANPVLHPVFGAAGLEPPTAARPLQGNLPGGRTAATVQLDTGHFGATTNPQLGRTFVEGLAAGGAPVIDGGTLLADAVAGCAGRADPLPG